MKELKNGTKLQLTDGREITVQSKLGEGGQGAVYKVTLRENGKDVEYALKYYKRNESEEFYKNLKRNIEKGSPALTFLWPLYITRRDNKGRFGYLMKIRPGEYMELSQFLLAHAKFKSAFSSVNCAMLIAASFKMLHNKGLSYQDLNDGNFFINPEDGDVLISDNDNVSPTGDNLGIQGKARYIAPEVVTGTKRPDTYSDRFSLAVILFLLLFRSHPLEGKRDETGNDPSKNEENLYSKNPIFIYDKSDSSNRPNPKVHMNVLKFWPVYPEFLREEFIRAFDKSLMRPTGEGREDRIIEKEWVKVLIKLKESIVRCSCCNEETFFDMQKEKCVCMNCGKKTPRPFYLSIKERIVPLQAGNVIYKYEIDDTADFTVDFLKEKVGEVVRNKERKNVCGIRNLSSLTWYRHTPLGKEEVRTKGQVIPIARDNIIKFGTISSGIIKRDYVNDENK